MQGQRFERELSVMESMDMNSKAVDVARAHVEAFGRQDYQKAESLLADDVHFNVLTTTPNVGALSGVGKEDFMKGLHIFGDLIVPGTGRIIQSWGDDVRALVVFFYEAGIGPDATRIKFIRAAHYLLDDAGKIEIEQVVFFPLAS